MKKLLLLVTMLGLGLSKGYSQSPVMRKGVLAGASLGISGLRMRSALATDATNLGINWKVGYILTPRVAVLLNGTVSIYENNILGRPRKRDFGGVFPSVQYWPSRRIWVMGGVGLGTDAPVFYDLKTDVKAETKYYSGVGGVAGVGYELYQKGNFTLDVQGRFNYSTVTVPGGKLNGLTAGVLFGFNFY